MVKRITVYTAFGQFIEMVERLAEMETEQKKEVETDRYPIDHPLSDYQNALTSVQDLSVKSCPVMVSNPDAPLIKSLSCPAMSFSFAGSVEAVQVAVSPIPTTIETRKLNEATELMMSFWKVHVTSRKPKTENEHQIASIFEKLDGLFSTASTTSVASIFGKFDEFIDDMKKENEKTVSLVWNSPDQPSFPQLPVFVKSPVDSMKFYKRSQQNTDEMADDELTLTPTSRLSSSTSSTTSSNLSTGSSFSAGTITTKKIVSYPRRLVQRIRLQQTIIKKQKKLIADLYKLQTLNQKLSDFRRGL